MTATVYMGARHHSNITVAKMDANGEVKALALRLDLANHSPTGFDWGYRGSGPAQLALAIVADATGDDALALEVYQDFKAAIVAGMPGTRWKLTSAEVMETVDAIRANRG